MEDFSVPQLDYAFGIIAFIGLVLAQLYPESISIDKNIDYFKIINDDKEIVYGIKNHIYNDDTFESRFVQNNFDEIFTELKKNKILDDEGKKLFLSLKDIILSCY